MRVTVICADLSQNGLGRALLLADMLGQAFDVDIVGTRFGRETWEPAAGHHFHRVVEGARWPWYLRPARQLMESIRGDVVYAIKPLPTSFGLALVHRARTGTPVVLDVDDDELAFRPAASFREPTRMLTSLLAPNGRSLTRHTVARAASADAVTVASSGLHAMFGGTLVPHAKDTDALRPGSGDRSAARRAAGLDGRQVVMFAGTPRPFKGLEDAAAAVRLMRNRVVLVVAGSDPDSAYDAQLRRDHPEIVFLPPFPQQRLASVLDMADAIVVPQPARPETRHQLPSKLLDAMAMAKPIVATGVADIPAILGNERGFVVPPSAPTAMASALDSVLDDPAASAAMGARARAWCVSHASFDAVRPRLERLFRELAPNA